MPTEFSAGRVRKIYKLIDAHRDEYSVQLMCQVPEVMRTAFYAWCKKPLSSRSLQDIRLLRLIRASFTPSHGIYGASRVFLGLREAGETCSKNRVARLMRQDNVRTLHGPSAVEAANVSGERGKLWLRPST
jgi:putative transposase